MNSRLIPWKTGLYIHIPYCKMMCHYCDFAKTANWDQTKTTEFFSALMAHTQAWLDVLKANGFRPVFHSVNIGGGTPSLFTTDYQPLMALIQPWLSPDCEISIEANPDDLTKESLAFWKDLGFNRMSVGVQTFQEQGLKFLKRSHNSEQARSAIELAGHYFDQLNVDLIYSWPGQTPEQWADDLDACLSLPVTHLSLYNLTFAPGTPIGRAHARGKIKEQHEDLQDSYYQYARNRLKEKSWLHDEVSNWSLSEKHSCKHNWIYWQGDSYLGIGPGAHGFLPLGGPEGLRYFYSSNELNFRKKTELISQQLTQDIFDQAQETMQDKLVTVEHDRTLESWLFEYIGCGLRSRKGIDPDLIFQKSGQSFTPNETISEAIEKKIIRLTDTHISLSEDEWFRETAWSFALTECFSARKSHTASSPDPSRNNSPAPQKI